LKFTDQGKVEVSLFFLPPDRLSFTVADTGIGIPADFRRRVFEPFVQVDGERSRRFEGAGLGLAICRQLADVMGGTIQLESRPQEGTTFKITIPAPQVSTPGDLPERAHILAVEDDPIGRDLLKTILERAGYQVTLCGDGRSAVEAFCANAVQLILMDIHMPGQDGLETAALIRAREGDRANRVPIVALTASVLAEVRERCFGAGMDDFVAKPIEARTLLDAVERWVGRPGALAPPKTPV
jgi:two-component system, sensor histidine kinase